MLTTQNIRDVFCVKEIFEVHSVYKHTVNIKMNQDAGDAIVAISPDFIDVTPNSIAIPLDESAFDLFAECAKHAQNVIIKNDKIYAGQEFWPVGPCDLWNPKVQCILSKEQSKCLTDALISFLQPLGDGGMSNSAVCAYSETDTLVTSVLRKQVQILYHTPESQFADQARELIGMGIGLTPSGDDFIVGLLLSLQIRENKTCEVLRRSLVEMIIKNINRTNEISGQYLLCACQGLFSKKIHDLVKQCDDEKSILNNLKYIQKTGHSSGIDLLNGLCMGLLYKK